MRVYISGKLTDADPHKFLLNCHKMIKEGLTVLGMGYAPFIPCLDLLLPLLSKTYIDTDVIIADYDMPWLEAADILYLLPSWKLSRGARLEAKRAKELKIPCVFSIKSLKRTAKKLLKQKRVEKWLKPLEAKV